MKVRVMEDKHARLQRMAREWDARVDLEWASTSDLRAAIEEAWRREAQTDARKAELAASLRQARAGW